MIDHEKMQAELLKAKSADPAEMEEVVRNVQAAFGDKVTVRRQTAVIMASAVWGERALRRMFDAVEVILNEREAHSVHYTNALRELRKIPKGVAGVDPAVMDPMVAELKEMKAYVATRGKHVIESRRRIVKAYMINVGLDIKKPVRYSAEHAAVLCDLCGLANGDTNTISDIRNTMKELY